MTREAFVKLIDYYHQCVIEDREFKIAENVVGPNKYSRKTYLKLDIEQFEAFRNSASIPADSISRVRNELRITDKKEKELEYLIGFPIYHNKITKRVFPAFVFVVTERKDSVFIDFDDYHPNSIFFEELNIDLNDFRNRVEALNLDEQINGVKRNNVTELLNLLRQVTTIDDEIDSTGKIYSNTAIFFTQEKSNFTKGLENELKEISRLLRTNDELINDSALKYLFQPNDKLHEVDNVKMFTNLNMSQIEAIKLALSSGITNIQGPPGTGKSDVVLNIIFNAFINNKSVLFSSKNHKAIETVFSRLEKYLNNIPFLLKLGKTDGSNDLASILKDKLEFIKSCSDFMPVENSDLLDLESKSYQLGKEIDELRVEQNEINDVRLNISETYRRYIKGKFANDERLFENLRKKPYIQKAAIVSPRIKRMVNYHFSLKRAEMLQRVEETTEQIFAKRDELVSINKKILSLTVRKNYSSIDQKERDLLSEYQRLIDFWVNNTFESAGQRREFKERFLPIRRMLLAWSVSNLSVSGQLPLSPGIFDYVIIDEASQCDIPSSLCLMARAKSFIVVGDEMQLTHITNLSVKRRFNLFEHYLNLVKFNEWEYGGSSILTLIKHRSKNIDGLSEIMLNEHFRSKKEIIYFSNKHFYGDKLRIRTDYFNLKDWKQEAPFEWHNITGRYQIDKNKFYIEEEVVECKKILSEILQSGNVSSIGIISPFRLQVQKIREACESLIRKYGDEKEIVIDTITRFQGDEKDVIVFSLAVSHPYITERGKLKKNNEVFYLGNNNLINVGLTRAKSNLIVVGDKGYCRKSECGLLNRLAEYSEETVAVNKHLPETHEEQIIVNALKNEGFNPLCQYDFFAYRMDIALFEKDKRICVEVDGSQHEGAVPGSRNTYDNVRDHSMQREGWKVIRFWNYEVWHDLDKCVSRIKDEMTR